MKVTKIETFKCWVEWKNWLFVKVSTDEDLHGWGEASLAGPIDAVESAVHALGAALIGEDPAGVERHWQALYHAWRWRGGPVQATVQAALDMALWDIEGKRLGVPVHRLLGGAHRTALRGYASHWLGGADTPEAAYEAAQEAVRRGFTAFKWSPFRGDALRENENRALTQATALMEAARAGAGPDVDIFIECGESLSPRTAVIAARALAPYRPGWFEEPIPFENVAAMARLRREMPVPIATGERLLSRWEYDPLIAEAACQIIQPDVSHAAGITEVRKIAAMADTHYIAVAPHNSAGPIGTLATIHLAAAIPNFLILEQMEGERAFRDQLSTNPVAYRDGYFAVPTAPGLGTDLRLEVLAEHPYHPLPIAYKTESKWH